MYFLPQFQHGTGALTAEVLNTISKISRDNQTTPWVQRQQSNELKGPILAKITANEAMPSSQPWRWRYALEEVYMLTQTSAVHASDSWTSTDGTTLLNAVNLAEFCNTATHVQGIPITNLPGTFELKPIASETLVVAWSLGIPTASGTGFVYLFSLQNVIDGTCP
tara:strand:- start:1257 stop:1751 length:495 start_codon:yes stop_codon:yes gene_type:complete